MRISASARRIGLVITIVTSALVVCAHAKSLLERRADTPFPQESSSAWGVESAWPHLRQDCA